MRIDRAIENIQAAIDRHQDEWLKDNGYEPEEHVHKRAFDPEPPKTTPRASGQFSADRFLGESSAEPEQPEIISVIKNDQNQKHSWLYNEVIKAINDAAANNSGTKIIAVFIPVVRNGEEFNDIPFDETYTLPPMHDEEVHVEQLPPFQEFLSEQEENEPVSLEKSEPEPEPEEAPATMEVDEEAELLPEAEAAAPEDEPEDHVGDLLSGAQENPEELQDIFRTMEEKLEDTGEPEAQEPESEEPLAEELPEVPEEVAAEVEELPEEAEAEVVTEAEPEPEAMIEAEIETEPEAITELETQEPEAEESGEFAEELVDSIMQETFTDTDEAEHVDFDDLESDLSAEQVEPEAMEFTEIEPEVPVTEELPEVVVTEDEVEPEEPLQDEDEDFEDTEIAPDAENDEVKL